MTLEPEDMLLRLESELRGVGLNDMQLASIKFTGRHHDRSVEEWAWTCDPSIEIEELRHSLSSIRQYALLKFALIDGPAENSPNVSEAFAVISNIQIPILANDRLAYLGRQKKAAQQLRGFISEIEMTMREFVGRYSMEGGNRLLSAKHLWPGFGQYFRYNSGSDMILEDNSYFYFENKSLAYETFRNYVRNERKLHPH